MLVISDGMDVHELFCSLIRATSAATISCFVVAGMPRCHPAVKAKVELVVIFLVVAAVFPLST